MFGRDAEGFDVDGRRGVDRQQWTKHSKQVLFGFSNRHWLREAAEGNIEELLDDLIADDSFPRVGSTPNQMHGLPRFCGCVLVEGVNENVGVEKESSAHSSRPWYRGPMSERAPGGA